MHPTILVVEDETILRLTLAESLRAKGYCVVDAASADEAVGILASGLSVDAVLTDVHMPGQMSGFDLAEWISKNRPSVPVVVTSGDARTEEAQARNVTRFVAKPYHFGRMVKLIAGLIDRAV